MESLFKLTNLESRIQLNMNVIGSNNVPRVMNILEVLQEFLAHRQNIVTRRSTYLLNKIKHRLEILEGLRIAYLNLDEIIKIIREEDEPKAIMMERFKLTEIQVEAILNTRLRSLRKLEEQEIINEHSNLQKQQAILEEILNNPKELWKIVKKEIKAVQTKFGLNTVIGARRTSFEEVTLTNQVVDITAFITKEPITIICSKMGWVRSLKGHNTDLSTIKYKEGDAEKFIIEAYTTDKILIVSSEGRFFTLLADNISKGKGTGESIKLLVDIGNNDITNILVHKSDQLLLLASSIGKGFLVNSNEVMAQTKTGKQIMNVPDGHTCIACLPVNGDSIACIGESRKLLVFNIDEIPEMKKGQGVTLQKFKNAKLLDIKIFNKEDGLSWNNNGKVKLEKNIIAFLGKRGSTGKLPPMGFHKNNRFSS